MKCAQNSDSSGLNSHDPAYTEMTTRRAKVDSQLASLHLCSHNVIGDGNCLFRAISYAAYDTEDRHEEIRASAADYILNNKHSICNQFALDDIQFEKLALEVTSLKVAAGEHAIVVIPAVIKRDLIVHIAFAAPLVLLTAASQISPGHAVNPVQIAFYDGVGGGIGHYKAVTSRPPTSSSSTADSQPSPSLPSKSVN